jgi:hypothetical protein
MEDKDGDGVRMKDEYYGDGRRREMKDEERDEGERTWRRMDMEEKLGSRLGNNTVYRMYPSLDCI